MRRTVLNMEGRVMIPMILGVLELQKRQPDQRQIQKECLFDDFSKAAVRAKIKVFPAY